MDYIRILLCTLVLSAYTSYPAAVSPVENFELSRYLGKWYEVARLDHRFERGLSQVSAEYRLRDDGGIAVINRGFNAEKGRWQQAEGRAYFVSEPTRGHLKVSFFGPFYASYVVFGLGDDYQYAFVSGPGHDYLWLLAREPHVSQQVWQAFVERATEAGFDTAALIRAEP
ncbi:lipocalin family protein [Spongiibacter sp.]|uniref:lipocalin family protein n=1 Tax=Spongiibacter sp. TaxID=2024860 RepID=UPI00356B2D51